MRLSKLFAMCVVTIGLLCGQAASQVKAKESIDKKLLGYWKSTEAQIEFKAGNRITINGEEYGYSVVGSNIVVGNDDGQLFFPFKLGEDVLTVWVDNRRVVYTRLAADEIKDLQSGNKAGGQSGGAPGGVSQDLVGKWCYQSNVNAQGGGRMSNTCFTLSANGTYEYYSETSSSNPYGGSASQGSDAGRWTATATALTARSNSGKTVTYTLERRNHPKTGDPMLIVNGDAFVTFYQKRPW